MTSQNDLGRILLNVVNIVVDIDINVDLRRNLRVRRERFTKCRISGRKRRHNRKLLCNLRLELFSRIYLN